jgi:peptidoglycan hydrolase-like protein with peptidoglycan-binding domain
VPGVNGVVDVNRFYGDETDLRVLALSPSDKPVPPPSKGQNVMPWMDLGASSGSCSQSVAMVQGLLLAAGYGPEGLVGSNGRPDGIAGSKTLAALQNFQRDHGLVEGAVVDGSVWWTLLASK